MTHHNDEIWLSRPTYCFHSRSLSERVSPYSITRMNALGCWRRQGITSLMLECSCSQECMRFCTTQHATNRRSSFPESCTCPSVAQVVLRLHATPRLRLLPRVLPLRLRVSTATDDADRRVALPAKWVGV